MVRKQHTNRSELLRRGALAVLRADEIEQADQDLRSAYRRLPQDPAVVEAATRVVARGHIVGADLGRRPEADPSAP